MLDVIKVMYDAGMRLFDRVHLAAQPVDLRPAGDARLDAMSMDIFFDRVDIEATAGLHRNGMRSRTDQRHIAAQHIDQLRQLIDAQSTQDATDTGDPRVVWHGALRPRLVAPVDIHRAKFEHPDHVVIETEALLNKKYRSSAIELDQQRGDRHQRTEKDHQKRAEDLVFYPLGDCAPMLKGAIGDLEHRHGADVAHAANPEPFGDRLDAKAQIGCNPLQLPEKCLEPLLGVERERDDYFVDRNAAREAQEVVGRAKHMQTKDRTRNP